MQSVLRHASTWGLVVSVALNIGLAWRVREMRLANSGSLVHPPIALGSRLTSLSARDMTGSEMTVSFSPSGYDGTVLYAFSPDCHWCALNMPHLTKLYSATHTHYQFIGLALKDEGLAEYVTRAGWPYPVIRVSTLSAASPVQRIRATPTTLVVSRTGVIIGAWAGAYRADIGRQIATFFHLAPTAFSQ